MLHGFRYVEYRSTAPALFGGIIPRLNLIPILPALNNLGGWIVDLLTESQFEDKHGRFINIHSNQEQVSFGSALDNLYSQYKQLGGDEEKFIQLMKDWEIIS